MINKSRWILQIRALFAHVKRMAEEPLPENPKPSKEEQRHHDGLNMVRNKPFNSCSDEMLLLHSEQVSECAIVAILRKLHFCCNPQGCQVYKVDSRTSLATCILHLA